MVELVKFARDVRTHWLSAVVAFILVLLATCGWYLAQVPQYTSTAKLFLSIGSASSVSDLSQGSTYAAQVVKSYTAVATTPYVTGRVAAEVKTPYPASAIPSHLDVSAELDTVLISIDAHDSSPIRAAALANSTAKYLRQAVIDLNPDSSTTLTPVRMTLVQSAVVATSPTSPPVVATFGIGALLALAIGLVSASVRARIDTRIRSAADLAVLPGATVYGAVLFDADAQSRPLVVAAAPAGPLAESYRVLRTNLGYLPKRATRKALVITSATPGEGKSTTALNLAVMMSELSRSVVIVEADLRRPKISDYLGVDRALGLSEVLAGRTSIESALQFDVAGKVAVLPSGSIPPNPTELLQAGNLTDVLNELEEMFDEVIIDGPPLLAVTDAAILANACAGALLVCAAGRTRLGHVRAAMRVLERVQTPALGVIMTMVRSGRRSSYTYGGHEYQPQLKGEQIGQY